MPMQCSAVNCRNRAKRGCGKQFYRFPSSRLDKRRRMRWILATQRKDWEPTENSRICSDHFISGRPSERCDDPDYIPSVFYVEDEDEEEKQEDQGSLHQFLEQKKRSGEETLINVSEEPDPSKPHPGKLEIREQPSEEGEVNDGNPKAGEDSITRRQNNNDKDLKIQPE